MSGLNDPNSARVKFVTEPVDVRGKIYISHELKGRPGEEIGLKKGKRPMMFVPESFLYGILKREIVIGNDNEDGYLLEVPVVFHSRALLSFAIQLLIGLVAFISHYILTSRITNVHTFQYILLLTVPSLTMSLLYRLPVKYIRRLQSEL